MIQAERVIDELAGTGFTLISGVPCSYLTPLINAVIDSDRLRYVSAANEGDAVAIACGAHLGGGFGVVMFQNSGFGNAVNPLTSLCSPLGLPVLVIVTWRGHPEETDEPQHELMGHITPRLMETLEIPWEPFPEDAHVLRGVLERAAGHMRTKQTPYGLIMRKGAVAPQKLKTGPNLDRHVQLTDPPKPIPPGPRLDADAVLEVIQAAVGEDDVVLACTGFTGRALYALGDRPCQLYMVGSMGCASSLGLGLALTRPERRVVVLDGDGAILMRMGAMATLGHEQPPNLVHVLLDNAVHDSTGAQATVAPGVDFASVARACGYPAAVRARDLAAVSDAVRQTRELTFIHVRTAPRADRKLPRPDVTPAEVAHRLRSWIGVPS